MGYGKAHSTRVALSSKEQQEFDNITLDLIHECRDIEKLKRLEQYMNQEGFPQTATAVQKRLAALDAGKDLYHDQEARQALEQEYKESARELMSWTHRIVDEEVAAKKQHSNEGKHDSIPAVRKGVMIMSDGKAASKNEPCASAKPITKQDSAVGGQVRSGKDYYDKWEKLAEEELSKLDKQDECGPSCEDDASTKAARSSGPANTARLTKAAATLSPAERSHQAVNERNKGNEAFRAKEYTTAIEHYTLSTELDPSSAAARCNRAAAYLKVRMWSDAVLDCDAALSLEPGNVKALMRRATAKAELKEWSDVKEDALQALKQAPGESSMIQLVEKATKHLETPAKRVVIEEYDSSADNQTSGTSTQSAPAAATVSSSAAVPGSKVLIEEVTAPSTQPAATAGKLQSGKCNKAKGNGKGSVASARTGASTGAHNSSPESSGGRQPLIREVSERDTEPSPVKPQHKPVVRKIPIIMEDSSDDEDDVAAAAAPQAQPSTTSVPTASATAHGPPVSPHEPTTAEPCARLPTSGVLGGQNKENAADVVEREIEIMEDDAETQAADDALVAAALAARAAEAAGYSATAQSEPEAPVVVKVGGADGGLQDVQPQNVQTRNAERQEPCCDGGSMETGASVHVEEGEQVEVMLKEPEEVANELKAQGNAAFQAGKLDDAKKLFTAAADTWPLAAAAYSNRATASAKQGASDDAIRDCTVVLGLAPNDGLRFKAHCRRAFARQAVGDAAGAVKDLQAAKGYAPEKEKKTVERDINAAQKTLISAQNDHAKNMARKKKKEATKAPKRSTTYGKVTLEEMDSDDDDEAASGSVNGGPLAVAAAVVKKLLEEGSEVASQAQARAQTIMEEFRARKQEAQQVAKLHAAARKAATSAAQHPSLGPSTVPTQPQPASPHLSTASSTAVADTPSATPTPAAVPPVVTRAEPTAAVSDIPLPSGRPTVDTPQPIHPEVSTQAPQLENTTTVAGAPNSPRRHAPARAPNAQGSPQASEQGSVASSSSYVVVDSSEAEGAAARAPAAAHATPPPPSSAASYSSAGATGATANSTSSAEGSKPQTTNGGGLSGKAGQNRGSASGKEAVGTKTKSPGEKKQASKSGEDSGATEQKQRADWLRERGIEAWKSKRCARALELWSQAAQLAPDDVRVHLNIAQAQLQMGAHIEALVAAESALLLLQYDASGAGPAGGNVQQMRAKAEYRRGAALRGLDRLPEALEALRASHELMPNPETHKAVADLERKVPEADRVSKENTAGPASRREPWPQVHAKTEAAGTVGGDGESSDGMQRVPLQSDRLSERLSGGTDASSFVGVDHTDAEEAGAIPVSFGAEGHSTGRSNPRARESAGAKHAPSGPASGDARPEAAATDMTRLADAPCTEAKDGDDRVRRYSIPIHASQATDAAVADALLASGGTVAQSAAQPGPTASKSTAAAAAVPSGSPQARSPSVSNGAARNGDAGVGRSGKGRDAALAAAPAGALSDGGDSRSSTGAGAAVLDAASSAPAQNDSEASTVPRMSREQGTAALAQRAMRVAANIPSSTAAAATSCSTPAAPATAHDFLRTIRTLRFAADSASGADDAINTADSVSATINYVRSIPAASYKAVFKANLDGCILKEFLVALKVASIGGHDGERWCTDCLKALTTVERFGVVYAMLPASVRADFATVKAGLRLSDGDKQALAKIK